jgi:hypothetical protein
MFLKICTYPITEVFECENYTTKYWTDFTARDDGLGVEWLEIQIPNQGGPIQLITGVLIDKDGGRAVTTEDGGAVPRPIDPKKYPAVYVMNDNGQTVERIL